MRHEWIKLYGTTYESQNVWVEVDNKPKGIKVNNNSDNGASENIKADLVFLVDNSGSMSEEADAIARDIIDWSARLVGSGLDIKFACVGYDDWGDVSGAINFTTVELLSEYLNRSTGTSRTEGFAGDDAEALETQASDYSGCYGECGAMALRFADEYLKFRPRANRIYVNFTDEPNQPGNIEKFSVENFKDQSNWSTAQGTVHTVYSDEDITFTESELYEEYPWKLSEYTGGTVIFTSSSFSGVSLMSLPVTGAMENSYIIRFGNVGKLLDGQPHNVKITVKSKDKAVQAEREFSVVFGQ